MLWIDLVDILYLIVGVVIGYIICSVLNCDLMDDECRYCAYKWYVEDVVNDEE